MSAWLGWLDAVPSRPCDLVALTAPGVLAGWLSADERPHPAARRVDPRLLDSFGDAAWVSLVWPAPTAMPLFDDTAVLHARRALLSGVSVRGFSTVVVDSSGFAGSVWVADSAEALAEDPFRRLGPHRSLRVDSGFFGRVPRPPGPTIERYAGAPWPEDGASADPASGRDDASERVGDLRA